MKATGSVWLRHMAALLLWWCTGVSAFAQFTLTSTAAYSEGRFRQLERWEGHSVTSTVGYRLEKWSIRLAVPHHRVRGPSNVIAGIGRVHTGSSAPAKASGFADPVLTIGYALRDAAEDAAAHEAGFDFKPGLIDPGQLGSGQTDFGAHWGVFRSWDDLAVFFEIGARFVGNPAGWDLRDHAYATLGWKLQLTAKSAVGCSYTITSKNSASGNTQGQVHAFYTRPLGAFECQASVLTGATRASPSFGAMLTITLGL